MSVFTYANDILAVTNLWFTELLKSLVDIVWCGIKVSRSSLLNYLLIFILNVYPLYFLLRTSFICLYEIGIYPSIVVLNALSIFHVTIAVSMIVGAAFSYKMNEILSMLQYWVVLSSLIIPIALFAFTYGLFEIYSLALLWGFVAGFGIPAILTMFGDMTTIEERGRIAGFCTFVSFLIGLIFASSMPSLFDSAYIWLILGFSLTRFVSIIPLIKQKYLSHILIEEKIVKKKSIQLRFIFFSLLLPWFVFCVINQMAIAVATSVFGYQMVIITNLLTISVGLSAMIFAGLLVDIIGRRVPMVTSFSLIGIGMGLLALSPYSSTMILFYSGLYGIAWGCLTVLFVLVVWADIAENSKPDLYYALGLSAYFVSTFLVNQINYSGVLGFLDLGSLYLISAAILFLMIPVVFASPETLPPEARDRIWLEWYARQARRIREHRARLS